MRPFGTLLLTVLASLATPAPLFAQHATAFDIEDGGRLYRNNCVNCHGPDGNEIAGIDLGRGQFRRASSDADLVQVIRTGVPGTPMPPSNFSEAEAGRIVAYIRSLAADKRTVLMAGDPIRGKALFEGAGSCATCHRVNGNGSRLGPDLSDIGMLRRSYELHQSLLDPAAEVLPSNRFYRAVSKSGIAATGRLLNIDTFTVQLIDEKQQLRSFLKSDLREHGFVEKTPMPSFKDKLDAQQIADVVSYLISLKGRSTP